MSCCNFHCFHTIGGDKKRQFKTLESVLSFPFFFFYRYLTFLMTQPVLTDIILELLYCIIC